MDVNTAAEETYTSELDDHLDLEMDGDDVDLLDDLDEEDWPYDEDYDADEGWDEDDLLYEDPEARSPYRRSSYGWSRSPSQRRALARARARRRRLMLRRQRAARPRRPATRPAAKIRQTASLAKEASLKTDVLSDATRAALQRQEKRVGRTEASLAAHAALNQVQASFPELFENDLVKALVPLGSLAVLDPKRREGAAGLLGDPRVWGPAASLLVAGVKELRSRSGGSEDQTITGVPFAQLAKAGDTAQLNLTVVSRGRPAPGANLLYFTTTPDIIEVDQFSGLVTAKKKGVGEVRVFTTSGEATRSIPVSVLA